MGGGRLGATGNVSRESAWREQLATGWGRGGNEKNGEGRKEDLKRVGKFDSWAFGLRGRGKRQKMCLGELRSFIAPVNVRHKASATVLTLRAKSERIILEQAMKMIQERGHRKLLCKAACFTYMHRDELHEHLHDFVNAQHPEDKVQFTVDRCRMK